MPRVIETKTFVTESTPVVQYVTIRSHHLNGVQNVIVCPEILGANLFVQGQLVKHLCAVFHITTIKVAHSIFAIPGRPVPYLSVLAVVLIIISRKSYQRI